jgi:hypothetical protein
MTIWYDGLFLRFRLTCNYGQTDRHADQRATTLGFITDSADLFFLLRPPSWDLTVVLSSSIY